MTGLHPHWLPTDEDASPSGVVGPVLASGRSRYAAAMVGILFVLSGILLYLTRSESPVMAKAEVTGTEEIGAIEATEEIEDAKTKATREASAQTVSSVSSHAPVTLPKNPYTVKKTQTFPTR